MFRSTDLAQDLKLDILELKKELAVAKDDSQLLKVKIRKLQNEVGKRDRQIETLLDPRKFPYVKKIVSEKGASMLINLQERNDQLERTLIEKDTLIKRLQNDLQTKKLYSVKPGERRKHVSRQTDPNKCSISIPYLQNYDLNSEKEDDTKSTDNLKSASMLEVNENRERLRFRTANSQSSVKRAVSVDRSQFNKLSSTNVYEITCSNNDTKAQYEGLSRDHLLSIIESLKNNQQRFSPRIRKGGSPESDLERNELLCDTPHEEILQLQNYFMDMLSEVDLLKTTIFNLHAEQQKTTDLLKQKDGSILHLAKEIEGLKRPKSEINSKTHKMKCSSPSAFKRRTIVAKRHSTNASKAVLQIEKEADEKVVKNCTYTETELEPEQNEQGMQIIHTRTISIQKFDDQSNYICLQGKSDANEARKELQSISDDLEILTCHNEEQRRKQKFNILLEQMLEKTDLTSFTTTTEDKSA